MSTYVYKGYKQEDYVKNKVLSLKFTLVLAKILGFKTIDAVVNKANGIIKGFTIIEGNLLNAKGCYTNESKGLYSMGLDCTTVDIKKVSVHQAEELLENRGYSNYETGEREAIELYITKIWEDKVKEREWVH